MSYCNNWAVYAFDPLGTIITVTGSKAFKKRVEAALAEISKSATGEMIIDSLENSTNKFIITKPSNDSSHPDILKNASNGTGIGAKGEWSNLTREQGIAGDYWYYKDNAAMVLAHELVHAYQTDKGVLDRTKKDGKIRNSEIDACKVANITKKEIDPNAIIRNYYRRNRLPE